MLVSVFLYTNTAWNFNGSQHPNREKPNDNKHLLKKLSHIYKQSPIYSDNGMNNFENILIYEFILKKIEDNIHHPYFLSYWSLSRV